MNKVDLFLESRFGKAIEKWIFGFSDDYDEITLFFNVIIRLAIVTGIALGIFLRVFVV